MASVPAKKTGREASSLSPHEHAPGKGHVSTERGQPSIHEPGRGSSLGPESNTILTLDFSLLNREK